MPAPGTWTYGPLPSVYTPQGAVLEMLPDNRRMRLLNKVTWTDAQGVSHSADPGLVTDGQSIPRRLWDEVDSPFTGPGREPALIHDQDYQAAEELDEAGLHDQANSLRRAANWTFARGIASRGGRLKAAVEGVGVWIGRMWQRLARD
ncbi:MAG: DUF1353 domain-containing protein [Lentisphaerae bacterium]|nr:DUF1353 domain-containing protein [Lentisphaerota bacterium]